MNPPIKTLNILFLMILALTTYGCGGGGGSSTSDEDTGLTFAGNNNPATITSDNSENLAVAAASGAQQAIGTDNAPALKNTLASQNIIEALEHLSMMVTQNLKQSSRKSKGIIASRTDDYSASFCATSGSASATYPDTQTNPIHYSFSFNNCISSFDSYSFSYNGYVNGSYSESSSSYTQTINFVNFTVSVSYNGETEIYTINKSETCTGSLSGFDEVCEVHSDFTGIDNRIYRVTDIEVSGNGSNGYTINATVYDPDHGYFEINASGFTFCDSGLPDSGSITYSDGVNTGLIEFLSCDTSPNYRVTFNGVSTDYSW